MSDARARILLVEDNEVNRMVAVRLLERLGYSVETAENGVDALDAHDRTRFDAILMDCQMPEMDGFECASAIRSSDGPRRTTPIIALTANASAEDRDRCLAAGMNDFLTKPIEMDQLRAALQNWVA